MERYVRRGIFCNKALTQKENEDIIMEKDREGLNPCPECGSTDVFVDESGDFYDWWVECEDCCNKSAHWTTRDSAVNNWNNAVDKNKIPKKKTVLVEFEVVDQDKNNTYSHITPCDGCDLYGSMVCSVDVDCGSGILKVKRIIKEDKEETK